MHEIMLPDASLCLAAMIEAMRPYADALGAEGMLAVSSLLTGQLLAVQDQNTTTPAMGLAIVSRNIEAGNQAVVANRTGADQAENG